MKLQENEFYYTNYVTYPLKCSKNHLTCNVHFELWANKRFFFLVFLLINIYKILYLIIENLNMFSSDFTLALS